MTHRDACPIDKTMAEAITIQGRHVDPFNWVCCCQRLAAEYQRGRDDRSAEWQDVLSSANRRARDEALAAVREAVESAWTDDPSWDGTNWNNALTAAQEAIDALLPTRVIDRLDVREVSANTDGSGTGSVQP